MCLCVCIHEPVHVSCCVICICHVSCAYVMCHVARMAGGRSTSGRVVPLSKYKRVRLSLSLSLSLVCVCVYVGMWEGGRESDKGVGGRKRQCCEKV